MIRYTAHIQDSPKSISVTISPAGNEPLNQYWDETVAGFIPDRSLIPLTLVPEVLLDGTALSAPNLSSYGWWRIDSSGKEVQVTSSLPGHTLYPPGYPLGLRLTGNIPSGTSEKYIFRCSTARSAGIGSVTLRSSTSTGAKPSVELDCPPSQFWNPFITTMDKVSVTPSVKAYGKNVSVVWKKIENGVRRIIDTSDPRDVELSVDAATGVLTVDRRVMGDKVSLVCELYSGGVLVDEKPVSMTRQIPAFDAGISAPLYYMGSDTRIYAEAVIKYCSGGRIDNPSAELRIDWYDGTAKVGSGNGHVFDVRGRQSVPVGYDDADMDRGPWCLATDGDGSYLTDADGTLLLIR